jgi:hypothetical protein
MKARDQLELLAETLALTTHRYAKEPVAPSSLRKASVS